MNQAERIIEKFPCGPSWLAGELKTKPSTISTWAKRGRIPYWWNDAIMRVARKHKVNLTAEDFEA